MMRKSVFARLTALALAATLALALVACGGKPGNETAQPGNETTQPGNETAQPGNETAQPTPGPELDPAKPWLLQADFSQAPREGNGLTLLPGHIAPPFDTDTLATVIATDQYGVDVDRPKSANDKWYIVHSWQEVAALSDEFTWEGTVNISPMIAFSAAGWEPTYSLYNLSDQGTDLPISACLAQDWWALSAHKGVEKLLDLPGWNEAVVTHQPLDPGFLSAVLAKFGTPHRIFPFYTTEADAFRRFLDGEPVDGQVYYNLLWQYGDWCLTLGLYEKQDDQGQYQVFSSFGAAYYTPACWEGMVKVGFSNVEAGIDPHQVLGR